MCGDESDIEKIASAKIFFNKKQLKKNSEDKVKILFVGEKIQRQKFLESDLDFCELNKDNLDQLKKLNQISLSVNYNKQFYARFIKTNLENDLIQLPSFWTKLAFLNKALIAAVCCTIEYEKLNKENLLKKFDVCKNNTINNLYNFENCESFCKINIQTLACQIDKRRRGVASILLQKLIEFCKNTNQEFFQTTSTNCNLKLEKNFFPPIRLLYLHCQTSNEAALNLYKKFGFKVVQFCDGYYGKRFDTPNAYRLELSFD